VGVGLQLAAKVLDMRVHGTFVGLDHHPVDGAEQLGPREHPARLTGQLHQQVELRSGQLDHPVAHRHLAAAGVHRDVPHPEPFPLRLQALGAPQDRPHPGQ